MICLAALLVLVVTAYTQTIHTPAEILKIMSDSKIGYGIEMLKTKVESKDRSQNLNQHNYYRVQTDSAIETRSFKPNEAAIPLFDNAETFFGSGDYDLALKFYNQALEADTSLYYIMTYIGQIYEHKGDFENVKTWYLKAIDHNYIDYMAHWFLADAYFATNDLKNAVDEITIARILNRNNPRIKDSMSRIYKKAKLNTNDWSFTPQMILKKESDTSIKIAVDDKWMGYALPKALWLYEPGYKTSMGVREGEYSTLEDKECLVDLLVALANSGKNYKNDPQLSVLKKATDQGYFHEYIMYEVVLPDKPFVAFQLPVASLVKIKDYILKVRSGK